MTKHYKILITGAAGFIGYHLVDNLIKDDRFEILGLDIINDYYDVNLKYGRLKDHGIEKPDTLGEREFAQSTQYDRYRFLKADLTDHDFIVSMMLSEQFDFVVNLAAQAGVRYSIENPKAYVDSNIKGFLSILEGCKLSHVKHLVYASTSSVYGLNTKMPLSEDQPTQHPMSFYSATKKANELMAHVYSHLFGLPTTGLRFFTVYGPWGRPDMALFLFADAMIKGKPINVFNYGDMVRDFTYVTDIAESVKRLVLKPAQPNDQWDGDQAASDSSPAPYRIFNIGNNEPVQLKHYIEALEAALEITAEKHYLPMQPGDVPATHADTTKLEDYVDYKPQTSVQDGVSRFVTWYKDYFGV